MTHEHTFRLRHHHSFDLQGRTVEVKRFKCACGKQRVLVERAPIIHEQLQVLSLTDVWFAAHYGKTVTA